MLNAIINWSRKNSHVMLRYSMAIVFLWFGILKFMQVNGGAEDLGYRTLYWFSKETIGKTAGLTFLGCLEMLIGGGLLFRKATPVVVVLLFMQLGATGLPLIIFPEESWDGFLKPSLTGHYIIKNLVFLAAGTVLVATVKKQEEIKLVEVVSDDVSTVEAR